MINKISNYVARGKGIGALLILTISILYGVYAALQFRTLSTHLIPYIQMAANELLPIKMENGIITTPKDTKKVYPIYSDDKLGDYSFTIDTSVDTLDLSNLKTGIYLTRSNFYSVDNNNGEIRHVKLKGNLSLEKKNYTTLLLSQIKWVVIFIALSATLCFFIVYFILNLFYTFLSKFALMINEKKLNYDAKMRLSAVCLSLVSLLSFIISFANISINWFIFMVLVVILQIIIAKKLP